MTDLAPMQVFRDIAVAPVSAASRHIAHGGPIWPDFDQQIAARHCRDTRPADACPATPATMQTLDEPAVWGGFLDRQFGHLIIEQMTRLPQSLRDRPDDLYLFTLPVGQTEAGVPGWVWQALKWYGLRRDRVRLVDKALSVGELRVAAQGEMMGKQVTEAAYLDLLDANMAQRALVAQPAAVVFVTRAGLVAGGQGGHAGEAYLAQVLTRAGVRVIDPARHAIAEQLAVYAGARVLVFSEGSALHGRMLLGRLAQDIHVLRRRPHRDIGAEQLAPRCRELRYHATAGRRLGARMPGGGDRWDLMPAFYDLEVVFDLFGGLGHDLRMPWDDADYRDAVQRDLHGWLETCRTSKDQLLTNLKLIADAGYVVEAPRPPAALP